MTLTFDPPRTCGDLSFTVVSECRISARTLNGSLFGHGNKRPSALVFYCDGKLTATDLRGRHIDADTLTISCPGLAEAMQAAAS